MSQYFPRPKSLGAKLKVELDYLIVQQKQTCKMRQVLIHRILLKKTDLTSLKSGVDKLDISKF